MRDVLDAQLIDRRGRKIGKVDGIVLSVNDDGPPRVTHLEIGAAVLLRRLPAWVQWAVERILGAFGVTVRPPFRIPWSKVLETGIEVRVDLLASETPLLDWEKWLARHVVGRIPGA
jgi:hypothetical protein